MDTDSQKRSNNVRSVLRALSIIELFGPKQTQLSIKGISESLDLPSSTTMRLVQTLESEEFIRKCNNGLYAPGPRLLNVAAAINGSSSIKDIVHPHLETLRDKTGETACFANLANMEEVVYLDQCSSAQSIRHVRWIGERIPVKGTAIGFVLEGSCSRGEYRISETTYETDVSAVAAPIYARDGSIVGAINITGPSYRLGEEDLLRIANTLIEEVAIIESQL